MFQAKSSKSLKIPRRLVDPPLKRCRKRKLPIAAQEAKGFVEHYVWLGEMLNYFKRNHMIEALVGKWNSLIEVCHNICV